MPPVTHHCTFCDLIGGAGEVSVCYEDSVALAFMDIQPVNAGHVLVVPRRHFESLEDLPPELALHLFEVALKLEPAVRQVTSAQGMNMVVNSGKAAGRTASGIARSTDTGDGGRTRVYPGALHGASRRRVANGIASRLRPSSQSTLSGA